MKNLIWGLIAGLLLISGLLQSCKVTEQKKIDKARIVALDHPESFADICSKLFPVNEKLIKGKDSLRIDTLIEEKIVKVPVVVKGDTIYVDAKCPKIKVVTNTIYRTDTLVQESTSKLKALQVVYDKKAKDYEDEKLLLETAEKTARNRLWYCVGLALLLAGMIILKLRK